MDFRRTIWGVGLLGALALPGCSGDDTPTPDGRDSSSSVTTGAGGAGNDASTGAGGSAGKSGGSATDSGGGGVCIKTAGPPMAPGRQIQLVTARPAAAGADAHRA